MIKAHAKKNYLFTETLKKHSHITTFTENERNMAQVTQVKAWIEARWCNVGDFMQPCGDPATLWKKFDTKQNPPQFPIAKLSNYKRLISL